MESTAIRLFLLLLIFAAVVLGIEGIVGLVRERYSKHQRVNRRLQMIEDGNTREVVYARLRRKQGEGLGSLPGIAGRIGSRIERALDTSGLKYTGETLLVALIAAVALIAFVAFGLAMLKGFKPTFGLLLMIGTFAIAAGFALPMMALSRLADQRRKKIQEQFPVALDVFVRGLRAGHPVSAALNLLTEEMTDPIGSELGMVVDEVTYGAELRDALQNFANRWQIDEIHMFVVSLSVQAETGGNLAEILENLAQVIRDRHSMLMKVRALSSEGRMTALILTALPIVTFVGLFLVNPAFFLDVAQERAFIIGYAVLTGLYAIGFITIRRMIDLKV